MIRSTSLAIASLFAVIACTDNVATTAPIDHHGNPPADPTLVQMTGTVAIDAPESADQAILLVQDDGSSIQLVGSESVALANVVGGQVWVRGTLDASPGLVVDSFEVLVMRGRPAFDGVLEDIGPGLALRLSDGTYRYVSGAPTELAGYIGARLWVTGSEDNPPVEFGVIEDR